MSSAKNSKAIKALLFFVVLFIVLTIVQDAIEAYFRQSAFYLSESFLFSSFWWVFAPLLYAQYITASKTFGHSFLFSLLSIMVPVVLHLLVFPVLVWTLSGLFYDHTFSVRQTLEYTLSVHLYLLIIFYAVPFLFYRKYGHIAPEKTDKPVQATIQKKEVLTSITVMEANRHSTVAASDILYITAGSPYIFLHTGNRKYLHSETLTSIQKKLDDEMFIRIHKSSIINIREVKSYTSRLNGDYDIILADGSTLRLSRNYAARFKEMFGKR